MPQPNILLFMVDQLTSFVLSAYGGSVCRTPNLDALAARGVVFENAHCAYPLCAPSRCAMMSGRLPSRIGAYDNGAEFAAATPTFAHYLRRAGYHTCLSGKMHFVGPDQFHGFEERLTPEIYPADMSWTPDVSFDGHTGDRNRPASSGVSTVDTVRDAGPVAGSLQIDYDEDVVHQAIGEIRRIGRRRDERPFLLTVSLTQPHDPYVTLREYWDLYDDAKIDAPQVAPIPVAERDPHSQAHFYHYGQDKLDLSAPDVRRARRGYYGMISHIDHLFGRIVEALEATGAAKNTVIVFTSDHGDMMGERGMWFKKTLYNPAVQVPMIVAGPGIGPRRVKNPVSLLDLFPTFAELAGAEVETPLDGTSLVPALSGFETDHPIFIEHLDGGTAAPRLCVRDGDKKLIVSTAYPTMYFDLSRDPMERHNLAGTGDPDEARLTALADKTWNIETLTRDITQAHAARRAVDAALATGRVEPWDFEATHGVGRGPYVRRGDSFPEVERRHYIPEPGA